MKKQDAEPYLPLTPATFGLFAGLALLIAVAGIGGIIALSVRQRIREIGIRMTLGRGLRASSA